MSQVTDNGPVVPRPVPSDSDAAENAYRKPSAKYENIFNSPANRDFPITYAHVNVADRENIVKFERVFGKHARRQPVQRYERYNQAKTNHAGDKYTMISLFYIYYLLFT
jgi:hypothetical protein